MATENSTTESKPWEASTYLGDGAYAKYIGYAVELYTSDGILKMNQITLEPEHLKNLIEFCRSMHMIP